ncbi:DUF4302 domain-containing protein [Sphingobacterium sp. SGR-19]|uniref:DUF4302 domain-containing protein n=1 Tax=Sphingobacterium sp. SGR-19 TaxID=2710886 RepID=UPI0013EC6FCE|nr:DUF4302 domain-containing protein [Sphingobacterium sp. SGR-19]NGM64602.1 DUF4302 domain-containing protein [Sphingobacterium sp. SGR-19]
MKLKHIIFTFLLPVLLITSCKREQDRIFEENASVRMTEAIANAYEVLQGNEAGWVMTYYPSDNQEFGGYTIFTKFISNAQVTMVSDAIESSETSTYSVIHDTGPVLSFNGYNKAIHWFSEPGMDNGRIGADDTGMKGDFEFIVLKATADSVVLKGKKSGTEVVMLPLSGDEFEQQGEAYQEAASQFSEFGVFKLEDASGELLDMPYSSPIRVFRNPKDNSGNEMSFRVIPSGLEFYAEQEMEGVRFKTLKFVEPTTAYPYGYYTDDNTTFKIVPDVTPLNLWFISNEWYMAYSKVGSTGQIYWDRARTALESNGLQLNEFSIGSIAGLSGVTSYLLNNYTVGGLITHNLVPVPGTTDQVRISLAGSIYTYTGMTFGVAYWNAGLNQFTTPFNNRTFVITTLDALDRPKSILLTDTQIPTNTFELTLDAITDPFNN